MSPLLTAGEFIRNLAFWLQYIAYYAINIALAVVIALLVIRFLIERFNLNPFGRLMYYVQRPTNRWFYEIKSSQFYHPIRQALGFDPVWVLLLLAFVMFFFLLRGLISDVTDLLISISLTLSYFGAGNMLTGGKALLGTVLLALIYFFMALMTILVINSWFGLFDRAAYWAGRRIYPILRTFDSSGRLGPLVFLLMFFLLGMLANAVKSIFF